MNTNREAVTVEDVEADPTNCYQVTVHGDVAIKSLSIHGEEGLTRWTSIQYANGGSSAGEPAHWHAFVRITETPEPTVAVMQDEFWTGKSDDGKTCLWASFIVDDGNDGYTFVQWGTGSRKLRPAGAGLMHNDTAFKCREDYIARGWRMIRGQKHAENIVSGDVIRYVQWADRDFETDDLDGYVVKSVERVGKWVHMIGRDGSRYITASDSIVTIGR